MTITGTSGDDVLTGSAADTFDAQGGNDRIVIGYWSSGGGVADGGAGSDALDFSELGASIQLSGAQAIQSGTSMSWSGIESFIGTNFNDTMDIHAESGAHTLLGGLGNDVLQGGSGADTLDGGSGVDWASYVGATAGVVLNMGLTGPQNTVGAGVDTLVSIEKVDGSAFADTFTAAPGGSMFFGEGGNDLFISGPGNDSFYGGVGVDTVSYANATSGVRWGLPGGGGADIFMGIEKLVGSPYDDHLAVPTWQGGALNGGGGGDDLFSEYGSDILNGGGGSDFADYQDAVGGVTVSLAIAGPQNTVSSGLDELISIEKLSGSAHADHLTGDAGSNALYGVGGADVITGGGGQDYLSGGGGFDTFVFASVTDSTVAAPDTILDFQAGEHIDLHQIDADTGTAGDQAFHVGATPGHAGDIVVGAFDGTHTLVSLYVNGDATPDAAILLNGDHHALGASDFIL